MDPVFQRDDGFLSVRYFIKNFYFENCWPRYSKLAILLILLYHNFLFILATKDTISIPSMSSDYEGELLYVFRSWVPRPPL